MFFRLALHARCSLKCGFLELCTKRADSCADCCEWEEWFTATFSSAGFYAVLSILQHNMHKVLCLSCSLFNFFPRFCKHLNMPTYFVLLLPVQTWSVAYFWQIFLKLVTFLLGYTFVKFCLCQMGHFSLHWKYCFVLCIADYIRLCRCFCNMHFVLL